MSDQELTPELAAELFGARKPEQAAEGSDLDPVVEILARHDEAKRRRDQALFNLLHPPKDAA